MGHAHHSGALSFSWSYQCIQRWYGECVTDRAKLTLRLMRGVGNFGKLIILLVWEGLEIRRKVTSALWFCGTNNDSDWVILKRGNRLLLTAGLGLEGGEAGWVCRRRWGGGDGASENSRTRSLAFLLRFPPAFSQGFPPAFLQRFPPQVISRQRLFGQHQWNKAEFLSFLKKWCNVKGLKHIASTSLVCSFWTATQEGFVQSWNSGDRGYISRNLWISLSVKYYDVGDICSQVVIASCA